MPKSKLKTNKQFITASKLVLAASLLIIVLLVIGIAWSKRQDQPTPASNTTTNNDPAPPPATQTEQTKEKTYAGWNRFESQKYGFSVMLPPQWLYEETEYGLEFGTKLSPYSYADSGDAYGFIEVRPFQPDYGYEPPGRKTGEEKVVIDGVEATKTTYEGSGSRTISFPQTRQETYLYVKNGRYYYIRFTSAVRNESYWNSFNSLLSSWEFQS